MLIMSSWQCQLCLIMKMRQEVPWNWTITHCVAMAMSTYLACKSASASATGCLGAASLLPIAPEVVGRPVSWNKMKLC